MALDLKKVFEMKRNEGLAGIVINNSTVGMDNNNEPSAHEELTTIANIKALDKPAATSKTRN